ncbi:MAG: ATP-binding cassette domain-containing protein, partial [Ruminococcus sp.]|nr:ATP-binding cassette domain-containing protein [Ruminococcus sp.]
MNFISIQNVRFSYDDIEETKNPVYAVDGVSLEFEKGGFTAVIGHNGCGKSTLAKHLNAMLLPDSGKVYVDGDDTSDENKTYDIREKVGLVLQNPDNQLVASIVEED